MAYNRKMRKFEGTCYIPGEQLAMMAKYYRGANLNLNLTLFEDDLASMQETLDQACWCSKLDELDRMKMSHMKGNEWRSQHDHCLEEAQQGPGRNPKVYPALPQSSRSAVGKVERGTSAVSLYDRERGLVRCGRYQRDDSEPRNRKEDYYDRKKRRDEYDGPRNRRGCYSDPRNDREDYDMRYRRYDYPGPPVFHAEANQNEKRTGRNMGGPPDRRCDMESEAAMSSLPEVQGEIRCAVCNVETCLVCKNHLNSSICQCKCAVANAGLCIKCNQEPCEEDEQLPQETGGNKMDMSCMMLSMMMSSMFKHSQAPESVCCCKPSRENSESSSSGSSDGKVHKVYLYDCEDPKKTRQPNNKSKKGSSDSSSACDCCKCSNKPKKKSGKKEKGHKTSGEETSESDGGQKRQSTKGKGSKDSNTKLKGGDSSPDRDIKSKGSKESIRKSTADSPKSNKSSKEDDTTSVKSENLKSLKMNDENKTSVRGSKGKSRESKAQGSIDNKNVQFSHTKTMSTKLSPSPRKSPQTSDPRDRMSELLDTQYVPDLERSNHNKIDGDTDGIAEESSGTFSLKEFIVCLPKIQSNLQSLMCKLNQMDLLNNQLPYAQIDSAMPNAQVCLGGIQTRHDVPLLSPPQIPLYHTPGLLCDEHPQPNNQHQKYDSEISLGYSPIQNLPSTVSPGSSIDEPKLHHSLNPPTMYHSVVNFSNLGERPEPIRTTADDRKPVPRINELAESTKRTQSTFKMFPPVGGAQAGESIGKSTNQWSIKGANLAALSPSLIFSNINQNLAQPYLESQPTTSTNYCEKQTGNILHCQNVNKVSTAGSHNVEIIELPESNSCNQGSNLSKKSTRMIRVGNTGTSSHYEGETIFQSYNRESSAETSNQDLTYYASFTDEKNLQLSPATSAQRTTHQRKNQIPYTSNIDKSGGKNWLYRKKDSQDHSISKCSRNDREERILHRTRSVLKVAKRATLKAKHRNPLSLEKLVQGCNLRGRKEKRREEKNKVTMEEKVDSGGKFKMKLLDQGVGPGKFHRSKSDSSLDPLSGNIPKKSSITSSIRPKTPKTPNKINTTREGTQGQVSALGKVSAGISLKKKRSTSPLKEKARYTMATQKNSLQPNRKESSMLGKFGFNNIPSSRTTESDSIFKMSDAYVRQEIDSQSYIVSSVEVKTVSDHGSSTDILRMVQGIASSSLMNSTNVSSMPHKTAPISSDNFDITPLLPLSSTAHADGTESGSENQTGAIVKKRLSFDNEVTPSTPAFLRKSRVQVEQLKRAHETIRSMIKNVNDVIAHIDSDSKIGIKSKDRGEDKERQSYFVHIGDDDEERHRKNNATHFKSHVKPDGSSAKPACSSDLKNREVREMFSSVNRVMDSVLTPSGQSSVNKDAYCPSENTTPSRAHRDFFVLNSESMSTAFTDSLRRSLENDTSRSIPLATQPVPRVTSQSTRPLKRRSWFPTPKK